jgi:fructose-1,6-bisphosphatase/inositol monophosphatase family enzyme
VADAAILLEPILALHDRIRDAVVYACETQTSAMLAAVDAEEASDTIYRIDRVSEEILIAGLREAAQAEPLCLVAEGIAGGVRVLPEGATEADCRWRVLVDPIDGTRGLMYQKRSAWILTGVAPNRGSATRLRDIVLAVQTEIPLVKQHLSDQLWAMRGRGVQAKRYDRISATSQPIALHPSRSDTIAHGFATVARFFPGVRDILASIDDEIATELLGAPEPGKAACFEDQYLSTGGQLYELMAGHDRFIADVRPLTRAIHTTRGLPAPLCCHPYDLCSMLIAEELGVSIAAPNGDPLDAPFDLEADVSWVGYANATLRSRAEPALQTALRRRGLMPTIPL